MAYTGTSIVDYLKSVGQPSDFAYRSSLATQKGISNYAGTAEQNLKLLNLLRTSSPTTTPTNPYQPGYQPYGQTSVAPKTTTPLSPTQPVATPAPSTQPTAPIGGGGETPSSPTTFGYTDEELLKGYTAMGYSNPQQMVSMVKGGAFTSLPAGFGGYAKPATTPAISPLISQTGDSRLDALLSQLTDTLTGLTSRGQVINPTIEITPEKVAEFISQAEREISPYYASQLKLAKEGFLRSVGYTRDELLTLESDMEKQYGKGVRQLGEQMAEQGFAYSGVRKEAERELAEGTQSDIDKRRRQLSLEAGTAASQFAQQWGGRNMQPISMTEAPRVIPGTQNFQKGVSSRDVYTLSPDLYDSLIGEKQWEEKLAKSRRVSDLEEATRALGEIGARKLTL